MINERIFNLISPFLALWQAAPSLPQPSARPRWGHVWLRKLPSRFHIAPAYDELFPSSPTPAMIYKRFIGIFYLWWVRLTICLLGLRQQELCFEFFWNLFSVSSLFPHFCRTNRLSLPFATDCKSTDKLATTNWAFFFLKIKSWVKYPC